MKHAAFLAITASVNLIILGCVATPQKYIAPTGVETAELNDSAADSTDGTRPAVFVVDSIDGQKIANALNSSRRIGSGFGTGLASYLIARPVPAKPMRLHLIGVHVFRAPVEEIAANAAGRYRRIEGDLDITLAPGKIYQVSGKLDADPAAIWIEDWATKERVSSIIGAK